MFIISYFIGIYEDKTKKCKFGTKDYVMNKIINKFSVLFFVMVMVFSGIFAAAMPQVAMATASGYVCYDDPAKPDGYDPNEGASLPADAYLHTYGHALGYCKDGTIGKTEEPSKNNPWVTKNCSDIDTSVIDCVESNEGGVAGSALWHLLLLVINILSAGIGLAAVGGAVYGAVLYSSAGANPDNVKKAKEMFVNIGIGVVAYLLMYSLLNYLIPGGLFN